MTAPHEPYGDTQRSPAPAVPPGAPKSVRVRTATATAVVAGPAGAVRAEVVADAPTWPDAEALDRAGEKLAELRSGGARIVPGPSPDGHPCVTCGAETSTRWRRVWRREDGDRDFICGGCDGR